MINTAQISSLLRPGLASVFGDYSMYPAQWAEVFEKKTSDKAVEIDVEIKMLGLAALKSEGANIQYDTMGQRYLTNYVHRYVAIGFIITRQAMKDNLYKSRFPMQSKALRNSMEQTKEILGAAVLNNGFNSSYPIGDGQAVFSTAHPIDTGTVSNTFSTNADLSETSLQDAIVAIQIFQNAAGLKVMVKPQKLIVPPQLQFQADRLLESAFRTQTANNDISAIYNMGAIPQGYRVNQFLTDPNAWFLLTDADDGFKYYDREPLETDMYTDFDTKSIKVSAIERYSFGVTDFRAGFGTTGTN